MRQLAIRAAGIGLLALSAAGAGAEEPGFGTVGFFLAHCKASMDDDNSTELFRQGQCSGLLAGAQFLSREVSPTYRFCSPPTVEVGELVAVAVAYLDRQPDKAKLPLLEAAIPAFQARWPC